MTAIELPHHTESQAYWLGYLASAVGQALRHIGEADAAGNPRHEPEPGIDLIREALVRFADSPVAASLTLADVADHVWDGWIVEDALGDAQAWRPTFDEADDALADVERYWWEATAGGNGAMDYVAKRQPYRIRQITKAEGDVLREYPAVIDREP